MSTLLVNFHPELTRLGWALIHLLWQGLAAAVALELALLLAGNSPARLRYFLCSMALAALPVCFVLTYAHLGCEFSAPRLNPAPDLMPVAHAAQAPIPGAVDPLVANYVPQAEAAAIAMEPRASFLRDWNQIVPYVTWVWLAGVMILGARKAGGLVVLSRLRRHGADEPEEALRELFRRACARIGVDPRRVCLRISHLVRVPMTMGWLSPIVLFPAALASGLSTGEIELILAHELAHVRRWDYLVNLLQAVVETLFFYHPLTWWISRRMRQERENCCDDLVAEGPQEKLAYARTLLRLEELRAPGETLAAAATGGVLRRRIERLVNEPASGMAGGITIALVLLLALSGSAAVSAAKGQNRVVTGAVMAKAASVVVSETKEFVGDVGRLYHAMVYQQTSAAAPKEVSWQFIADMANNVFPVTSTTVALPAGSAWAKNPATVVDPKLLVGAHYLYVQGFKSQADLLANFPCGTYTFNIQPDAPAAAYAAPVAFSGAVAYPPQAPVITNKTWDAGALVLDPASAEITYTNYPGATLTWEIVIPGDHYIMSAGGGGTALGSLNLTGLLAYGQTYVAQLRFINRDKSSTVSQPDAPKDYGYATMMAQIVEFTIKTPAPHASAAPVAPSTRVAAKISAPITSAEANEKGIAAVVNGTPLYWADMPVWGTSNEAVLRSNYSGRELEEKLAESRLAEREDAIQRKLVIEDAEASGYVVPQKELDDRVDFGVKGFHGDKAAFVQNLQKNGLTLEKFNERNRGDLLWSHEWGLHVYEPSDLFVKSAPGWDSMTAEEKQKLFTNETTKLSNELIASLEAKAVIQRFDDQLGLAAMIDGHFITRSEVESQVAETDKVLRQNYSGDELQKKLIEARKNVLHALIDRRLIVENFHKQGGFIPKSYTDDRINDIIRDQYGGDRQAFLATLAKRGISDENYRREIEENAIVGYSRNKFVEEKVWDYWQAHPDQFPQDERVSVTVLEIPGKQAVPPGQVNNFAAENNPQADEARHELQQLRAGADAATFAMPDGLQRRYIGTPIWVMDSHPPMGVPAWWPFTWNDIEKLKPGETSGVAVTDFAYAKGDGPSENRHAYWMLRVNARRPATPPTLDSAKQEKALLDAQARQFQEAWLAPLRAQAKVHFFDPQLAIDPWAMELPRATPVHAEPGAVDSPPAPTGLTPAATAAASTAALRYTMPDLQASNVAPSGVIIPGAPR